MSKASKSNSINHKKSLPFFHDPEPSCKFLGVFSKGLSGLESCPQSDVSFWRHIFSVFHVVVGLPKLLSLIQKLRFFRCCLQNMMAGCRILGRRYLGCNLQIKSVLLRVLSTCIQFIRRVRRIALPVVMET